MSTIQNNQAVAQTFNFDLNASYKAVDGKVVKQSLLDKIGNFFKSFTESGRAQIGLQNQAVLKAIYGGGTTALSQADKMPAAFREQVENLTQPRFGETGASGRLLFLALGSSESSVCNRITNTFDDFRNTFGATNPTENLLLSIVSGFRTEAQGKSTQTLLNCTPHQVEHISNQIMEHLVKGGAIDKIDFSEAQNLLQDIQQQVAMSSASGLVNNGFLPLINSIVSKVTAHHVSQGESMMQEGAMALRPMPNQQSRTEHLQSILDGTSSKKEAILQEFGITGVATGMRQALTDFFEKMSLSTQSFLRENSPTETSCRNFSKAIATPVLPSFQDLAKIEVNGQRVEDMMNNYRTLSEGDKKALLQTMTDQLRNNAQFAQSKPLFAGLYATIKETLLETHPVTDENKELINKRLAEAANVVLFGIGSTSSIGSFVNTMYKNMSSDVSATMRSPELNAFLQEVMDFSIVE